MKALAFVLLTVAACGESPDQLQPDASMPPPDTEQGIELQPAPADWLLLFDRSVSWADRFERFQGLKDAVESFVTERGTSLTLSATSFPRLDGDWLECRSSAYAELELAWGATPGDITLMLPEWGLVHESALGPALAGAGELATARRAAVRGRSTSIVLLTDAAPNEDEACDTSAWDEVAATSAAIFDAGRGPTVHVVDVMGTAVGIDHPVKVGAIAKSGGGYAAFVNGGRSDVANAAHDALIDLADRAATCTRSLPAGLIPERIRVSSPDGYVVEASRVASAAECAGRAFYFDDPAAPTTLTLCSGDTGIGGFCEATFVRARIAGTQTVTAIL